MTIQNKIFENIAAVKRRMASASERAGRNSGEIKLIAVSKGVSPGEISEAGRCGVLNFGENRIQEAGPKIRESPPGLKWHFIGPLQSNKTAKALDLKFAVIQTMESLAMAERMNRLAGERSLCQTVFLQVNIAAEAQKHGFLPQDAVEAAGKMAAYKNLNTCGLMCMGPQSDDAEMIRPYFKKAFILKCRIEERLGRRQELSMGMSHDFEAAIEEGATMVRLGSVIFKEAFFRR
ncbi:MAG: YggS family pyridoxal phosphate-dependent enzyme [Elusimicrobia bacterium]|nr:YggS family pyridoxal phosphate-dependent enzyme [Elusimicrobiota bacterium]